LGGLQLSRRRQLQEPRLTVIVRCSLLQPVVADEGPSLLPHMIAALRTSKLKSEASAGAQHPTMPVSPTPEDYKPYACYSEPRYSTLMEHEWARRARVEADIYRDQAEMGGAHRDTVEMLSAAEQAEAYRDKGEIYRDKGEIYRDKGEIYRDEGAETVAAEACVDEWGGGWRDAELAHHHHSRLLLPSAQLTPQPPQQPRPSKLEAKPSPRCRHADRRQVQSSQVKSSPHSNGKSSQKGIGTEWRKGKVRDGTEDRVLLFPVIPAERTKRYLQSYM